MISKFSFWNCICLIVPLQNFLIIKSIKLGVLTSKGQENIRTGSLTYFGPEVSGFDVTPRLA